ncbi:MAG: tetratricopeptide repeat protein [Desulfobacterales bacterium]
MKTMCKYHPKRPAYFSCPRCRISFCNRCVVVRDKGGYIAGEKIHACPGCRLPADFLGISNIVDPFWKRLHRFFLYPFGVFPVALMLVLAAASVVVNAGGGLIGALAMLLIWAVRIKYSYEVLRTTAGGDLRPPGLTADLLVKDFGLVFKQIILIILLGAACFLTAVQLGVFAFFLLLIFLVLLFPSMLILLVTTHSLFSAVNPFLFLPLAVRIGWGYLMMYFFLLLLNGAPTALFYAIIQYLPDQTHFFLFSVGQTYYSIISYHLMGYVLLQYSEAIGYQVDFDDFHSGDDTSSESTPASPEAEIFSQVGPLIQEGRLDDAIERIEIAVRSGRVDAEAVRDRLYALVKTANRPQKLVELGEGFIGQLTAEGKMVKAAQVYEDCATADAKFSAAPEAMLRIGTWLDENGRSREALDALNRLIKAHPESPLIGRAYFHAAQVLHTGLRNTEKARKILAALIRKFPDDEVVPLARQFLNRLQSY